MNDFRFVTNEAYAAFVKATGHLAPPYWLGGKVPAGTEAYPVVLVSAKDADAYCAWAGARLPTEEEREGEVMDATRPPFLWEWTATMVGESRLVHCGSWDYEAWGLHASFRSRTDSTRRDARIGFRCTPKEQVNG